MHVCGIKLFVKLRISSTQYAVCDAMRYRLPLGAKIWRRMINVDSFHVVVVVVEGAFLRCRERNKGNFISISGPIRRSFFVCFEEAYTIREYLLFFAAAKRRIKNASYSLECGWI